MVGCLICWLEVRELELFWQDQGVGRQLNLPNSFMEKNSELQNGVEKCLGARTAHLPFFL